MLGKGGEIDAVRTGKNLSRQEGRVPVQRDARAEVSVEIAVCGRLRSVPEDVFTVQAYETGLDPRVV